MFDAISQPIYNQKLKLSAPISLSIKRLDLIHPLISGNKFYKLKYNFLAAKQLGLKRIITFGGAYSNHIAATACAAAQFGFESIGIIRGQELANRPLNPTLKAAQQFGMQLHYLSRQDYRNKHTESFLSNLTQRFPQSYIIPEGGSNPLAIQGCTEILTPDDREHYDVICCAVGTGGTIAGLIQASSSEQKILGFSALKGDFLTAEVAHHTRKKNWHIIDDYCFGGYAKTHPDLVAFMHQFEQDFQIPLEPIYTGKMLFGIFDLIQKNYFSAGQRILVIHSGGLQGRQRLKE